MIPMGESDIQWVRCAEFYQKALQNNQRYWDEYCERKRLHREMTGMDLGLIYVGPPYRWVSIYRPDAPYSFWLGADG